MIYILTPKSAVSARPKKSCRSPGHRLQVASISMNYSGLAENSGDGIAQVLADPTCATHAIGCHIIGNYIEIITTAALLIESK